MSQRAVVTVMGQDKIGIVAGITKILAELKINIIDISQTLLQDIFAMLLMVELADDADLVAIKEQLEAEAKKLGVRVVIQHEDVFRYMHRV
ncbi:MAG TPA: ACT domain-containing protein [Firmicutes bacterium]|jgi:ACT domain-containing protein|nr:ACT domain-containing protein [Bacillota bacterium]HOQ24495.1 ACT domain-containing protein [Bacillota bacterium]HPT67317.1 ACT domain-containing protein [Bacillota bacterium]